MTKEQEWVNSPTVIFGKLTPNQTSIPYNFKNIEMQDKVKKEDKSIPTGINIEITGLRKLKKLRDGF